MKGGIEIPASLKGAISVMVVLLVITGMGHLGMSDDPEAFGIVGAIIYLGASLGAHQH